MYNFVVEKDVQIASIKLQIKYKIEEYTDKMRINPNLLIANLIDDREN